MQDSFQRTVDTLRISVTDLCNFRCRYCMGPDGVPLCAHRDILSFEEIERIAAAAVSLGVRRIRLTGGEPLVRRGIVTLCRMLAAIPGLEELTMTTNGSLLVRHAKALKDAGVARLNISLDTLDPEKFRRITRTGELSDVLAGIDEAERVGFAGTKINVVLLGGFNDDEIPSLVHLTMQRDLCVRFIEWMPIGGAYENIGTFLPADAVLQAVPSLVPSGVDGVAARYRLPGARGSVGLIPSMTHKFCGRCSRIRLTADGKLKPCLYSAAEIPLRGLNGDALTDALRAGILQKPKEHRMDRTHPSETVRRMFEIGG